MWCFATPADRAWWGGMWADRILTSAITEQAVDGGHADEAELREISAAWRAWATTTTAGSRSSTARSSAALSQSEISGTRRGVDTRPSGTCLLDARETVHP